MRSRMTVYRKGRAITAHNTWRNTIEESSRSPHSEPCHACVCDPPSSSPAPEPTHDVGPPRRIPGDHTGALGMVWAQHEPDSLYLSDGHCLRRHGHACRWDPPECPGPEPLRPFRWLCP